MGTVRDQYRWSAAKGKKKKSDRSIPKINPWMLRVFGAGSAPLWKLWSVEDLSRKVTSGLSDRCWSRSRVFNTDAPVGPAWINYTQFKASFHSKIIASHCQITAEKQVITFSFLLLQITANLTSSSFFFLLILLLPFWTQSQDKAVFLLAFRVKKKRGENMSNILDH